MLLFLATTALAQDTHEGHHHGGSSSGSPDMPKSALDMLQRIGAVQPPSTMIPWGQLQIFATAFDQDESVQADPASYGDPEADPGFQVARARFGFTGMLPTRSSNNPRVDYGLSLGIATPYDALRLGDSGVSMVDAFGRLTIAPPIGDTTIAVGLVKVPFSREALMSSRDLVFMERAVGAENLTSVRDVGLLARQDLALGETLDAPKVALSLGVFNGNADFLGDNDPGLMYSGRVELEKGDTYRTWDPSGDLAFGLGGSVILNDGLATRTFAYSADALIRYGGFSLMAEFGTAQLSPTAPDLGEPGVFSPTKRFATTFNASYFVRLTPQRTGDAPGIEFAVRASSLDDNTRLDDNGDVLIIHAGLIARSILPMVDLGAGFIHREELGGRDLPNDTVRFWTQLRPLNRR